MTPAELPFGTITRLPARIVAPLPPPAELVAGAEVTLRQSTADRVNLHMAGGSRTAVTIEATGQRAARSMADLLASPWPRLTAIEHCNGADIVLAAHEFTARLHWPASMRIGITEPVLAELRGRMQRRDATAAEVALRLAEELLLPAFSPGGEPRCLMSAGIDIADPARPFRMHGAAMSADIRRDDDGCLTITRVMGKLAPAARVVLVEADIGFVPLAELEPLSPVARGQLATLTVGTDQYLPAVDPVRRAGPQAADRPGARNRRVPLSGLGSHVRRLRALHPGTPGLRGAGQPARGRRRRGDRLAGGPGSAWLSQRGAGRR